MERQQKAEQSINGTTSRQQFYRTMRRVKPKQKKKSQTTVVLEIKNDSNQGHTIQSQIEDQSGLITPREDEQNSVIVKSRFYQNSSNQM